MSVNYTDYTRGESFSLYRILLCVFFHLKQKKKNESFFISCYEDHSLVNEK